MEKFLNSSIIFDADDIVSTLVPIGVGIIFWFGFVILRKLFNRRQIENLIRTAHAIWRNWRTPSARYMERAVIESLITALKEDEQWNVRLGAAEALREIQIRKNR